MYRAVIRVDLRPSILDPQGKAVQHALHSLGQSGIQDVRMGKRVELTIDAASEADARAEAEKACRTLLANAVTENFEVERIEPLVEHAA